MPANNEERKLRYMMLRKVGFPSKQATMYKDLSMETVRQIVDARDSYNKAERELFKAFTEIMEEIFNG